MVTHGTVNEPIQSALAGGGMMPQLRAQFSTYPLSIFRSILSRSAEVSPVAQSRSLKAIRYIVKKHHKEFDILLYVGHLSFRFHGLIQVPKRLTPKNFHFTGEILRKDDIDNDFVFNINNWDVNLSNYDLL
jgi:hypothetical protein